MLKAFAASLLLPGGGWWEYHIFKVQLALAPLLWLGKMSRRNEDMADNLTPKMANKLEIWTRFFSYDYPTKRVSQQGWYPFPVAGNGYCLPQLTEIQYNHS